MNKKQLKDEKKWFVVFFLTGAELNARVNECEVRRLNQLNSTV